MDSASSPDRFKGIAKLAQGSTEDKVKAVHLIAEQSFPIETHDIAKQLAQPNQPEEVRLVSCN